MNASEHKEKREVAEWKKKKVAEAVKLINEYPIVAVANLSKIPAAQLQKIMAGLRGKVRMFMAKKRLIKIALAEVEKDKKGIKELSARLEGIPALLMTKENPFILYKTLQKSKSKGAAKIGDIAPSDITIPAGPTQFTPGPVISELGSIGLKTGVENGKIVIKADKVVAKKGDKIDAKIANVLSKFNIEPMEIGLNIVCAYENGVVFNSEALGIDEIKFIADIEQQARICFSMCLELGILNKQTAEHLLAKAFKDSKAIALEANIMADAVVDELLAKAEKQAASVKSELKQ